MKKIAEEIKEVVSINPITLAELINKAEGIESISTDYSVSKVDCNNLLFNEDATLSFIDDNDNLVKNIGMSRHAFSQLCAKVGVPVRYLEKCIKSGRLDLAQSNINGWLYDLKKDLFIREYNGTIRGILSSRYSVCDSPDILKVISSIPNINDYSIKGSYLNEERLHLRLINNNKLPIDDDLFAGLFVDSSDVGRSTLTVKFGIYKQVCTNGLVVCQKGGMLFEQKHIGITADEFYERLVKSLSNFDELEEKAYNYVFKATKDKLKVYNTEDYLKTIGNITHLDENSVQKVYDLQKDKYDFSKWGLINGITEVAQDYTLEKRLELEKLAGNLLVA